MESYSIEQSLKWSFRHYVRLQKFNDLDLVVQALADTPATRQDYQKFRNILREALEQNLEPEQVEEEIRETTPFASLLWFLSDGQSRAEIWAVLAIVIAIILHIMSQQQPTKVEIVTPSVERVLDHNEYEPPLPPDPAHPDPPSDHK